MNIGVMAAATTTTISSTLAVVLICAASLVATGAGAGAGGHHLEPNDLVAKTCATVTRRHYRGPGLTRQFCESALRSDKRSAAARDARDLALVAMDLVQSGAAEAGAKVGGALRSGGGAAARWSKYTTLRLQYCRQDHDDVASTAPNCRALVREYNPRAGGGRHGSGNNLTPFEYLECAGRLVHAADDCWVHMLDQDGAAKKAVWKEIVEVASRANLAKAMVDQMVGVVDDHHH